MKPAFLTILPVFMGVNAMAGDIKINLNDKEYVVSVDDNQTAHDIFENISDVISLEKYAGHEYTTTLGFGVADGDKQTSELLAGHIYYWAPGNAFVINYVDYDISPYSSIHIGEFVDKTICDVLMESKNNITVYINQGGKNE